GVSVAFEVGGRVRFIARKIPESARGVHLVGRISAFAWADGIALARGGDERQPVPDGTGHVDGAAGRQRVRLVDDGVALIGGRGVPVHPPGREGVVGREVPLRGRGRPAVFGL